MRGSLQRLMAAPIAHRGLHGCGQPGRPVENSLGAAEAAIDAGFGIECDIQLTRDGEVIVFHDDCLDRLTSMKGRVADQDSVTLAGVALGETGDRIPTLAAFLSYIGGRAPLVIEIKSLGDGDLRLADRACALVASYAGCLALESFDEAVVSRCLQHQPACPVGLVGPSERRAIRDEALIARCDFLSWSIADLEEIASRFSAKPLTAWTVRTPDQAAKAARCRAQIVFEGFTPPHEP